MIKSSSRTEGGTSRCMCGFEFAQQGFELLHHCSSSCVELMSYCSESEAFRFILLLILETHNISRTYGSTAVGVVVLMIPYSSGSEASRFTAHRKFKIRTTEPLSTAVYIRWCRGANDVSSRSASESSIHSTRWNTYN